MLAGEYNTNTLDEGEQKFSVVYAKPHEYYNPTDLLLITWLFYW